MRPDDPLDLDAIEARANAATPGPWESDTDHCCVYAGEIQLAQVAIGGPDGTEADVAFIAHARADVLKLVAEVRRLRAILGGTDAGSLLAKTFGTNP